MRGIISCIAIIIQFRPDQDLWGIVPTFSCRVDAERDVQCIAMHCGGEEVRRSEGCCEKTREGALDDHCC